MPTKKRTAKHMADATEQALTELIEMSHAVGQDPWLIQGGGGNTSVKTTDGAYMVIKASGTALKDMTRRRGWRRLDPAAVGTVLEDRGLARKAVYERERIIAQRLNEACRDRVTGSVRPSVEAHLHALLDRCVIHLHPVAVGAYVSSRQGQARLSVLFGDDTPPPLWVPYTDPGFSLGRRMARQVAQYQRRYGCKPTVVFLDRHGLLVAGQTAGQTLRKVRQVIGRCRRDVAWPRLRTPTGDPQAIVAAQRAITAALREVTQVRIPVRHIPHRIVTAFLARSDASKLLATRTVMPDEVVYAHGTPLWMEEATKAKMMQQLRQRQRRDGRVPRAIVVAEVGLFVTGQKQEMAATAELACASLLMRMGAAQLGGVRPLTARQERFVHEWEAERFRRQVMQRK